MKHQVLLCLEEGERNSDPPWTRPPLARAKNVPSHQTDIPAALGAALAARNTLLPIVSEIPEEQLSSDLLTSVWRSRFVSRQTVNHL